ncbi:hypothetical protein J2T60_001818 [Natronospira proteinivora]|uniref:WD40 repeat protein n=1 Tax=Natronospira proteinivora TaxID=1807133 RepID=A0ABT1GBS7_9GAMM|nr:hypothetical protein [Natronospira proteinivora]MCP1727818.1 hypothetical protein [Natronospira proteinivora]
MSLARMGMAAWLGCSLMVAVSTAVAAHPSEEWRTLETERFRFHVPVEAEPWARGIVQGSEVLADEVHELVGYEPEGRIDVLVVDPFNQPNGMALPIIGKSRMVLFTTPPQSDSVIGNFAHWDQLLFIHEQAHLAHLARPPRGLVGPGWRRLWLPLGLGPLAQEPMWMIEGYATWVEGKLTGRGRPNSDFRDALIRQWALEGRLPSYGAVSRPDGDDWMARTMAYLVGSAYFDWLEEREGPEAFQDVWARATARERRSFSEAFKGVFGDSPADLYARFTAELTHAALVREETLADNQRWGRLWQDYSGNTGDLAVSPDGEYLALVKRQPRQASELKILTLNDNEARFERWHEQQAQLLERDPDDVKAVEPDSLPRSPSYRLPAPQARDIRHPRWIPGQSELLFAQSTVDARGQQRSDLFRWNYESGQVSRISRHASLHRADPSPEGDWAVAVRQVHGQSQLVRVDLDDGTIEAITEPRLDVIHDYPRFHPDGEYLAYMRHEAGRWQLVERRLSDGHEQVLMDSRGEDFLSHPNWSADGERLFFTRSRNGHLDLYMLDRAAGTHFQLTQSPHIAFQPEAIPDQAGLLYLSHGRSGMRVMKLDELEPVPLAKPAVLGEDKLASLKGMDIDQRASVESRPYGAGPQFASSLLGFRWHRADRSLDLGIRGGDPVGRLDWMLAASRSSRGSLDGEVASVGWHGWPASLNMSLFRLDTALGEQSDMPHALRETFVDQEQRGLRLGTAYRQQMGLSHWRIQGGLNHARLRQAGQTLDQDWLDLGIAFQGHWRRGDWRLQGGVQLQTWRGDSDDQSWERDDWSLNLGGGFRNTRLQASWHQAELGKTAPGMASLTLGGQMGTVNNQKTQPLTLYEPAIAAGLLQGQVYEKQALSLSGPGNARLFHRRHRMGMSNAGEGEWLKVSGFEVSAIQVPGILALPEVRGIALGLGFGQVHGEGREGHRRAWLNLRYDW